MMIRLLGNNTHGNRLKYIKIVEIPQNLPFLAKIPGETYSHYIKVVGLKSQFIMKIQLLAYCLISKGHFTG